MLITIFIGLGLSALCWVICNYYTRLWNKRYHLTITHHVLCGISGILTFIFVLAFSSLIYLKEVSINILNNWSDTIFQDKEWADSTFQKTFYQVKETGLENFEDVPLPGQVGTHIPVNDNKSKELCAIIYTNEASGNFKINHPFLSKVIWTKSQIPEEIIKQDMYDFFKTTPVYPPQRAIQLATNYLKEGLIKQTPRVVKFARIILFALFLLILNSAR